MPHVTAELERRQMFAEIKKLCVPDHSTNWICILREYAVLAAAIAGCMFVYGQFVRHEWPIWAMSPVYLLAIFAIGAGVQNRLSVLVHEASHYSLFKNRVVNDVAANLFLLFPVFGAIANYRVGHWGHHRHVNDPEHDPDLQRLQKHYPQAFPISKGRFLIDYVLKQVLIHNALSYLKGRALYVAMLMKSEPVQGHDVLGRPLVSVLRIAYYGALFSAITWFGWWPHYLLFWVVPAVTFYPAVLFLREVAHHGNYPDSGDFTNSRVYKARWLEREIFFPFGEHNHVLHHMFPTIPHHRMHEAHEVMLRYPPYRDSVVTCNGFFVKADVTSNEPSVLDILESPSERYLRGATANRSKDGDIRRSSEMEVGAIRSSSRD